MIHFNYKWLMKTYIIWVKILLPFSWLTTKTWVFGFSCGKWTEFKSSEWNMRDSCRRKGLSETPQCESTRRLNSRLRKASIFHERNFYKIQVSTSFSEYPKNFTLNTIFSFLNLNKTSLLIILYELASLFVICWLTIVYLLSNLRSMEDNASCILNTTIKSSQ